MAGLSLLTAAQLSYCAYTALGDYQRGYFVDPGTGAHISLATNQYVDDEDAAHPVVRTLESSGWQVDIARSISGAVTGSQLLVLVNSTTNQAVIAFKGSQSKAEFLSDFVAGSTVWRGIRDQAQAALASLQVAYPGYEILTVGHSLGGSLAQTFAVKNNLNGYGQNSLPIAPSVLSDVTDFPSGFASALEGYVASVHGFSEVNTSGDIATFLYQTGTYINSNPITLNNPYGQLVKLSAAAAVVFGPWIGSAAIIFNAVKAHLLQTVIASLQAGGATATPISLSASELNAATTALSGTESVSFSGTTASISRGDGAQFSVTPVTSASAMMALSSLASGQGYVFDGTNGYTVSGSSLVGNETALVFDPSLNSALQFQQRSSSGSGVLELFDGTLITTVPIGVNSKLVSLQNDSGLASTALTNFLTSIGSSINTLSEIQAAHLDSMHFQSFTPTVHASPTFLRSDGRVSVDNIVSGYPSGSKGSVTNITGSTTVLYTDPSTNTTSSRTAYNVLYLGLGPSSFIDFSQGSLQNIQEFRQSGGQTAMTVAQFNSFEKFYSNSNGSVHLVTSGTASLAGDGLNTAYAPLLEIYADSQSGTTIIGDANVTLHASMFGNDTLVGGNNGGTLYSGYGVNTLTGGSGNDTFKVLEQLASGSAVSGGSGADTIMQADSSDDLVDISKATISGVESLSVAASSVKVAAGGLNSFSSLSSSNATATTLLASVAGTYNISAKSVTGYFNLTGSAGNDVLTGHATKTKKISGGAGNDRISYSSALTSIDGGTGTDTLVLSGGFSSINLANSTIGSAALSGIEGIDASGATGALTITGDANDNTISGGQGADTLLGSDGDDTIAYDSADVTVDGGAGNDTLVLNQTVATSVNLGNASDQVTGGGTAINFENIDGSGSTAALSLTGDNSANVLVGGSSVDAIDGGGGNDTITYSAGDTLIGGGGTDTLRLNVAVATSINLGSSNQVVGAGSVTGFERVDGGSSTGALTMVGTAGADTLTGGAGDDTLTYDTLDRLDGGSGSDTLLLSAAAGAVTVDLSAAIEVVGGLVVKNFENVEGISSTSALTVAGDANDNTLKGGSGADALRGAGGGDRIYGRAGNDVITYTASCLRLDGGADVDTLKLAEVATVDLSNAADQVLTGSGVTTGFENIDARAIYASMNLTGDAGSNVILDGRGMDIIDGGGGVDYIYSSGSFDRVIFDANDAEVKCSGTNATLVMTGTPGVSVVDLSNTSSQVASAGIVAGFTDVDASGSTTGLTLSGSAVFNDLKGGSGADTLSGGVGAGDDFLTGGGGFDYVDYGANTTAAVVNLVDSSLNAGVATGDSLVEIEGIKATASNDTLRGNDANNVFYSRAGDDRMYGFGGNDTYKGARGYGADYIIENDATAGNRDVIEFGSGVATDQLWFSRVGDNLQISIIGTADNMTVDRWYVSPARQIESIKTAGMELLNTKVEALVSAMSSMTPPPMGQTDLTAQEHLRLDGVIAANWS